jgi:hypothetical protein
MKNLTFNYSTFAGGGAYGGSAEFNISSLNGTPYGSYKYPFLPGSQGDLLPGYLSYLFHSFLSVLILHSILFTPCNT